MRKVIYVFTVLLSMLFIGGVNAAPVGPDSVQLTDDISISLGNVVKYLTNNSTKYISSECVKKDNVYYAKTDRITDNESRECALRQTMLFGHIKEWDEYIINNIDSSNYNENDKIIDLYIKASAQTVSSLGALSEETTRINVRDELNKKMNSTTIDLSEKVTTCDGLIGPNVGKFISYLRKTIMILGPILALVLGTYEMMMAVAKGEDEDKKKAMKRFKNRLVASALLIIIPILIPMIVGIVNPLYAGCI